MGAFLCSIQVQIHPPLMESEYDLRTHANIGGLNPKLV